MNLLIKEREAITQMEQLLREGVHRDALWTIRWEGSPLVEERCPSFDLYRKTGIPEVGAILKREAQEERIWLRLAGYREVDYWGQVYSVGPGVDIPVRYKYGDMGGVLPGEIPFKEWVRGVPHYVVVHDYREVVIHWV